MRRNPSWRAPSERPFTACLLRGWLPRFGIEPRRHTHGERTAKFVILLRASRFLGRQPADALQRGFAVLDASGVLRFLQIEADERLVIRNALRGELQEKLPRALQARGRQRNNFGKQQVAAQDEELLHLLAGLARAFFGAAVLGQRAPRAVAAGLAFAGDAVGRRAVRRLLAARLAEGGLVVDPGVACVDDDAVDAR